jgi:hypothetical protein
MTTTLTKTTPLSDLNAQLAEARSKLQALVDAEAQVLHAAMADLNNGARTSEVDRFKTEQLGLLREPLAAARKDVASIQSQIDSIARAETTAKSKARHSNLDASIEADRKELDRCKATVKQLEVMHAQINSQLLEARQQRLKLAQGADDLIKDQALALAAGGKFDDKSVKAIRVEAADLADKVMALELAVKELTDKIAAAKSDVSQADRNLHEMIQAKASEDDQKLLAKLIKAAGSASELGRVVIEGISKGGLPKPPNAWKVG